MPEKTNNFNNENNNDFDKELNTFLKKLNKEDFLIKRESLRKFSKAFVLKKIIQE